MDIHIECVTNKELYVLTIEVYCPDEGVLTSVEVVTPDELGVRLLEVIPYKPGNRGPVVKLVK